MLLPRFAPSAENVLADRQPKLAKLVDSRHAAQFERPETTTYRRDYRCECGRMIKYMARFQHTKCHECRNREQCRERYRQTVQAAPRSGRLKSPWEGN